MAEYIEREAALRAMDSLLHQKLLCVPDSLAQTAATAGYMDGVKDADIRLRSIPAADVRPVVLCKDCKHKGWVQEPEHGKSVDYCRLIERCVDKQFFCAAGEKREES